MSRSGIIATKIGNSSYYSTEGNSTEVTVLKVDECIVSNIKTIEKDGYNAVQLISIDAKENLKKVNKPQRKIFTNLKVNPKKNNQRIQSRQRQPS